MTSAQSRFLTLLFLDVPNVVEVREEMGEEGQRAFQQRCLAIVNQVRKQHGGAVVRNVGSTVLCAFELAEDAVRAACVLQETAHGATNLGTAAPVFRIGLHAGEVILRNGGCVGEAVTASSRIVTLTKNHQILATREVFTKLPPSLQRQFMEVPVQATSGQELQLYEVIWRSDGTSADPELRSRGEGSSAARKSAPEPGRVKTATAPLSMAKLGLSVTGTAAAATRDLDHDIPGIARRGPDGAIKTHTRRTNRKIILKEIQAPPPTPPPPTDVSAQTARLCLLWQQKIIVVDPRRKNVSMGRDEVNDIVINVGTASREHAEVVCRGEEFYLVDHSWNGTFIYDEDGTERFLHDDEIKLGGSGVICPGCPGSEAGVEAIRFIQAN